MVEVLTSPTYYPVSEEEMLAYAKDAIKADIERRDAELALYSEHLLEAMQSLPKDVSERVMDTLTDAVDMYLREKRRELQYRKQVLERFSQWIKERAEVNYEHERSN